MLMHGTGRIQDRHVATLTVRAILPSMLVLSGCLDELTPFFFEEIPAEDASVALRVLADGQEKRRFGTTLGL